MIPVDKDVLLARQPILNRDGQVAAFELLFRGTQRGGDAATSEVLLNAFDELDIDLVVGKHPAFVNFTRPLLFNPPPFDQRRFVIEVLEDIVVDEALLHRLYELRLDGFRIALDDFVYQPHLAALVKLADIVKVDVLAHSMDGLTRQVQALSRFAVTLLAEKIETQAQFDLCRKLGFELFQGYYFAQPELLHGTRIPPTKQAVLRLLAKLADPEATYEALQAVIGSDPVLSMKLLRLVNSAALARGNPIHSLSSAVALLGMDRVRSWGSLLALSQLAENAHALLQLSLVRAFFCEAIGKRLKQPADRYFTVGLLSTIEGFVHRPLADIIAELPLSEVVSAALLHRRGGLGSSLHLVIAVERAQWHELERGVLEDLGLSISDLQQCHRAALQQSGELLHLLTALP